MDITVARQPIFDDNYSVIAYELLYQDGAMNFSDGNTFDTMAESILLANRYLTFGINHLVENHLAFIRFDIPLINSGVAKLLNKEKTIIELMNSLRPDTHILSQLNTLKSLGYIIAVDNFTIDYSPEMVNLCNIVKLDFSENTTVVIKALAIKYKKLGKLLLAKNVETKDQFDLAKATGFNYFEGFYFSDPIIKKKKELSPNIVQYMELMDELSKPDPNTHELSTIIGNDIALTYKLLKLVNSKKRFKNEISSIKQALALLGINELKKWLSLIMVHDMGKQETNEAVKYSLIRSSFLKQIAQYSSLKWAVEELSLLGTLSTINTILETTMENAIQSIPLTKELKETLLGKETIYSDAYTTCLAYERGSFETAQKAAKRIHYDVSLLPTHYLESIEWADHMFKQLKNNDDKKTTTVDI